MSRIGFKPITIPEKVEVKLENSTITVKGPLGELSLYIPDEVTVKIDNNIITVTRKSDKRRFKMMHGTIRSLIENLIIGVTEGYKKELVLHGVGYRVALQGNKLLLNIGYKHPIELEVPEGLKVEVPSQTEISIFGIDKEKVGHFAARIRALRPPEPYKGKGIRYKDEHVRKKVVKTLA